jgi:SAM-dependent methyltransferase
MSGSEDAGGQKRLVVDTFNEKASGYTDYYEGGSNSAHSFTVRRRRVFELAAGHRGRLLDIGCGPGVMVEHLAGQGFEFYGVDISEEMIAECRRRFGHLPGTSFSVGAIEHIDAPDAFFDVVVCVGVMEYLDDDVAAVRELARVLKPGGVAIVTVPNRLSPYRWWQRTVYRGFRAVVNRARGGRVPPEVAHRENTEGSWRRLMEASGFRVTDVVYYNFMLALFPLDRILRSAAVALSRHLEGLCRGRLRRLGTGFIVKAARV